jgi:hypothetical protein
MRWEALMLEGYPSWEPMIFGAADIRNMSEFDEMSEANAISRGDVKDEPVSVPDDIQ